MVLIWWWETDCLLHIMKENKRPFHNFGNSLVKKSINILFGSEIQDIMTGYRAFSYLFVKNVSGSFKGL